MPQKPNAPFKLNPTRIFLIAMLAVALGLAAITIISSFNVWREQDAVGTTDAQ